MGVGMAPSGPTEGRGLWLLKQDLLSFSINCCQLSFPSIHFSLEVVENWLSLANLIIIDTAWAWQRQPPFKLKLKNQYPGSISEKLKGLFVCLFLWFLVCKTALSGMRNAKKLQVLPKPGVSWPSDRQQQKNKIKTANTPKDTVP